MVVFYSIIEENNVVMIIMLEENKNINNEQREELKEKWQTFMSDDTSQPTEDTPMPPEEPISEPSKSNKGLIILLIVLIILIGLGVGGWFSYKKYYEKIHPLLNTTTSISEGENQLEVENMKNKATIAQTEVRQECSNASLTMVDVIVKGKGIKATAFPVEKFQSKYGMNIENSYDFVFNSLDCSNEFTTIIKFDENRVAKVLKLSPNTDKKYLSLDKVRIGYTKVMNDADKNGGQDYKNQHNDLTQSGPYLLNYDKYGLCWQLLYEADMNDIFVFTMNAETGKIVGTYKGSKKNDLLELIQ
jgi:hypothetical protein